MTSLVSSGGAFFKDQYCNQITRLSNPNGVYEEIKDDDRELLDSGDLHLTSLRSPEKVIVEAPPV